MSYLAKYFQRNSALIRKRVNLLRNILPNPVIKRLKSISEYTNRSLKNTVDINYKSKYRNIFHCALQKTGTQWMYDVLSDPIVYKYSGMDVEKFNVPRRKSQAHPIRSLDSTVSKNTIVSCVSGTYENFVEDIPKGEGDNAVLFVIRDPREMIVSWYFSTKDNHLVGSASMMHVHRNKLRKMSKKDGLKYSIELFDWKGKFEVMRSWMDKGYMESVKIVKFEDLTQNSFSCFRDLFDFMDIKIPKSELTNLTTSYSFETLTGREKGEEDKLSHMRSGKSESWRQHFDDDLTDLFNKKARDIVEGYEYEI